MAKLGRLSEENQVLFDRVIEETGIVSYVNFEMFTVNKSKNLIKISRANATTEYLAKKPDTVCIYVYEAAFDMLNEEDKIILIKDALANVSYDGEKDKIIIGAPTISVTVNGRQMFGDKLINAAESGVWAIQQIAEKEKEEKEMRKAKKSK